MGARGPSEASEQYRLAKMLDRLARKTRERGENFLWCHVANERRDALETKKLKGQGVKPGVPDVLIFCPVPVGYKGVALELKREGATASSLSKEQKAWLRVFDEEGWWSGWAAGCDAAVEVLKTLGYEL